MNESEDEEEGDEVGHGLHAPAGAFFLCGIWV